MYHLIAAIESQIFTLLDVEVACFGMMHDDGVGGLFRLQHEFFGQVYADPFRLQQLEELRVIFEVRTGRVTETVP